jgi:hypothetical protein
MRAATSARSSRRIRSVPLGDQLPDPRPEHEGERADQRTRSDECGGGVVAPEEDDRATHQQRDPEHGQRAARPHGATPDENDCEAGDDKAEPENGGERQAERDEQHRG